MSHTSRGVPQRIEKLQRESVNRVKFGEDLHPSSRFPSNSAPIQKDGGPSVSYAYTHHRDGHSDRDRGRAQLKADREECAGYKGNPNNELEQWEELEQDFEEDRESWEYYEAEEVDVNEEIAEEDVLDNARASAHDDHGPVTWRATRAVGSILVERAKPTAGRGAISRMERSNMAPQHNVFQQCIRARAHYEPHEEAAASVLVNLGPHPESTYTVASSDSPPVRQQVLRVESHIQPRAARPPCPPVMSATSVRLAGQQGKHVRWQGGPAPAYSTSVRPLAVVPQSSPNAVVVRPPHRQSTQDYTTFRVFSTDGSKPGEQSVVFASGGHGGEMKPFAMVPPQRTHPPGAANSAGTLSLPTTPFTTGITIIRPSTPVMLGTVGTKLAQTPSVSPNAGQRMPAIAVNQLARPVSQDGGVLMRGSIMIRNPATRVSADVDASSAAEKAPSIPDNRLSDSNVGAQTSAQAVFKQGLGVAPSTVTAQKFQLQQPRSPQFHAQHQQMRQEPHMLQPVHQVQLVQQHQQSQSQPHVQNLQPHQVLQQVKQLQDVRCSYRVVASVPTAQATQRREQQHQQDQLLEVKKEPQGSLVAKTERRMDEGVPAHIVVKSGIGSIIANKHVDASKGSNMGTDSSQSEQDHDRLNSPRGSRASRGGRGRGTVRRGANRGGASFGNVHIPPGEQQELAALIQPKTTTAAPQAPAMIHAGTAPQLKHQQQHGLNLQHQTLPLTAITVDVPVIFFPDGTKVPLELAEKDSYAFLVVHNAGSKGASLTPTAFNDPAFVASLAPKLSNLEERSCGTFRVGLQSGKFNAFQKLPGAAPLDMPEISGEQPTLPPPSMKEPTGPLKVATPGAPAVDLGTPSAPKNSPQKPIEEPFDEDRAEGEAKAAVQRQAAAPVVKPGHMAVCNYCGFLSPNFTRCGRCGRLLPPDVKEVADSKTSVSAYQPPSKTDALRKMRFVKKSRKPNEPECLTLSSDEDGEEEGAKSEPEFVGRDLSKPARPPVVVRPPASAGIGSFQSGQIVRFSCLNSASPVLRPPGVLDRSPEESSTSEPLAPGKLLRKWVVDGNLSLCRLSRAIEAQKNYLDEELEEPFDWSGDFLTPTMPVVTTVRSSKMSKREPEADVGDAAKEGNIVGAAAGGGGGSQPGGDSSKSTENERKDDDMDISDEDDDYEGEGDGDDDGDGKRRKRKDPMNSDPDALRFLPRVVRIGSYKAPVHSDVIVNSTGLCFPISTVKRQMLEPTQKVRVNLKTADITGVWVYFGIKGGSPVVILYTSKEAARNVRQTLNMPPVESSANANVPFFCPSSRDESRRRIIIFLDETQSELVAAKVSQLWRNLKTNRGDPVYREISREKAQDIITRAMKSSMIKTQERTIDGMELEEEVRLQSRVITYGDVRRAAPKLPILRSTIDSSGQPIKLFTYKPQNVGNCRSQGGSVEIFLDDYNCLEEEQFLNDTVIDFYLKYVVNEFVDQGLRKKIFVFSTYFYNRLTNRKAASKKSEEKMNAAEKRHERVKQWTKGVDIFSKDFIVVPINENSHWFLAIICFPGLNGPVRASDNAPVTIVPVNKSKKASKDLAAKKPDTKEAEAKGESPKKIFHVGSTTITPKKGNAGAEEPGGIPGLTLAPSEATSPNITPNNGDLSAALTSALGSLKPSSVAEIDDHNSDRDEAEGDDEDLEEDFSDEVLIPAAEDHHEEGDERKNDAQNMEQAKVGNGKVKEEAGADEPVKQPCILIFDSLRGGSKSRSRIIATLREYLEVEWKHKHGEKAKLEVDGKEPNIKREIVIKMEPNAEQSTDVKEQTVYRNESKVKEEDDGAKSDSPYKPHFNRDTIRGHCVVCPQQDNFSDCGLYVLQYVESFFVGDKKVTNFRLPIKGLLDWFTPERMRRKRKDLADLFIALTRKSNPELAETIPQLTFDCDQFEVGPTMQEYNRSLFENAKTDSAASKMCEQRRDCEESSQDPSSADSSQEKLLEECSGSVAFSNGKELTEKGQEKPEELHEDGQSAKKKRGFSFAIPRPSSTPTLNQQETVSLSVEEASACGSTEVDSSKAKKRKLSPDLISETADSTS